MSEPARSTDVVSDEHRELQEIVDTVAGNFRRDLDTIMADQPVEETAWLIELPGPAYYGSCDDDGLNVTSDHARALRFARAEDAQAVIDDIGWTEAKPVEHMWTGARISRAPIEAVAVDMIGDCKSRELQERLLKQTVLNICDPDAVRAYLEADSILHFQVADELKRADIADVALHEWMARYREQTEKLAAPAHPLPQGEAEPDDAGDHARGCQGREYTCTCGYDERRDALVTSLRAERDEWSLKGQMMADAAGSWMARAEAAESSLAAEKQRVVDLERRLAEDLDVRRLNELKADCSVLRKRVVELTADRDSHQRVAIKSMERVAALEGALTPFAAVLDNFDPSDEDDETPGTLVVGSVTDYSLTLGDFRRAAELGMPK